MENIKYYKVKAKCGHVGKRHYIPIVFPIAAENRKVAAMIARSYPRVKRQHEDAILSVLEISYLEYNKLKLVNNYDKYLKCKSRHEQDETLNLIDRLEEDNHYKELKDHKVDRISRVNHNLRLEALRLNSFLASIKEDLETEECFY